MAFRVFPGAKDFASRLLPGCDVGGNLRSKSGSVPNDLGTLAEPVLLVTGDERTGDLWQG